ncbi:hypothetical protein QCA50_011743 [Cerrena zonata]|uniref:Uncharacterized protein n=1 Tax=Cerrena zonata TaxID=2478898 RepID=A0AAW0G3D1_9APHY
MALIEATGTITIRRYDRSSLPTQPLVYCTPSFLVPPLQRDYVYSDCRTVT